MYFIHLYNERKIGSFILYIFTEVYVITSGLKVEMSVCDRAVICWHFCVGLAPRSLSQNIKIFLAGNLSRPTLFINLFLNEVMIILLWYALVFSVMFWSKHTHPKVSILALFLVLSLLLLSFIHLFPVEVLIAICFFAVWLVGAAVHHISGMSFSWLLLNAFLSVTLWSGSFHLRGRGKGRQTGSEDSHFWPGISASVLLITWLIYREPSAWTHPGEHCGWKETPWKQNVNNPLRRARYCNAPSVQHWISWKMLVLSQSSKNLFYSVQKWAL